MKEFEVSAKPRISPLLDNAMSLKEVECRNQEENEFDDKRVSVKHNKINPSPMELQGAKLKRLKDSHKVQMLEFDESD